MADYYTHFSRLLDLGTEAKADQALDLFLRLSDDEDAEGELLYHGFDLSRVDGGTGGLLWIRDDDSGDIESLIAFVLRLAEELDLSGLWGFDYANTCSRPRIDAFGGGAHVIDLGRRKSIGWTSTQEWLAIALTGEDPDA